MPTLPGGRALLTIVIVVAVVVGFGRLASTMYVEILWHAQTGYSDVFWLRVLWQWGVRVVAGVAIGALVFLNLRIMSETLGGIQIKRRFGNLEISEQLPRSYVLWGMGGASALLALWFGGSIPQTLGLQLLFDESVEFGCVRGLGIIPGKVVRFKPQVPQPGDERLKVPHMGWNTVSIKKRHPLFESAPEDPWFYFVHSYYVVPDDPDMIATTTNYGIEFVSGIQHKNIYAFQFHPEKSQKLGLEVLEHFAQLN